MSWRNIAKMLGIGKSTVSDFLRTVETLHTVDTPVDIVETVLCPSKVKANKKKDVTHFVIPDSQVKASTNLDWLRCIGEYIVAKKPDVIIHLGDFADLESLSSYDKGKKSAEGRRIQKDIDAAVKGMETLLAPLRSYQQFNPDYQPRMVLTLGNHEDRLTRHIESNPELEGFLTMDSLQYEQFGWEVVPFLTPINIDGINYCHFFANPFTGKPYGGSTLNILQKVGESFTQGHKQTLDVATRFLPTSGTQQWGLIAGACYPHNEGYKGVQGNHHFRGVIVKHNVHKGSYDPMFVSLKYLMKRYKK
jgi:hypothetical protein